MKKLQRLIVVTGHYGSGKTEFSVNLAIRLRQQGKPVTIVDLDIVNPYFRTNDVRKLLEEQGIKVIAPKYAGTNMDVPALPAEIYSVFDNTSDTVIFDVGGDDKGATALGRFKAYFAEQGYDMLLVANTKRPLTQTADEIVQTAREIEIASRLQISGLVNNTNLMQFTTAELIIQGQKTIEQAANMLATNVDFICAAKEVISEITPEYKDNIFEIDIYLQKP